MRVCDTFYTSQQRDDDEVKFHTLSDISRICIIDYIAKMRFLPEAAKLFRRYIQ